MPLTRFDNGVVVGNRSTTTDSYIVMSVPFSFDPTSATQVLLATLPVNARVMDIVGYGGATGGASPTVDIGTLSDDDGLANEMDCDAVSTRASSAAVGGALINTVLSTSAETAIYGKVGASAATGGTFSGSVEYIITG